MVSRPYRRNTQTARKPHATSFGAKAGAERSQPRPSHKDRCEHALSRRPLTLPMPTPLIRIHPERIISWGLEPGRSARTVAQ